MCRIAFMWKTMQCTLCFDGDSSSFLSLLTNIKKYAKNDTNENVVRDIVNPSEICNLKNAIVHKGKLNLVHMEIVAIGVICYHKNELLPK